MSLRPLIVLLVSMASTAIVHAAAPDAREAALAFGRALTTGNPALLRTALPAEGKLRLRLVRMGPQEGVFGPSQVEAVLGDFLEDGEVRDFEVVRVDSRERSYALIHARARVIDRRGRPALVALHLALQFESGRWVLREIKETGG